MNDPIGTLAEELRVSMARKRLAVTSVADRTGMQARTLNSKLLGTRGMTVNELVQICRAIDERPSELLARAEAAARKDPQDA